MHARRTLLLLVLSATLPLASARASWTDTPPPLPAPTGRVVRVSTEPELQAAVAALASDTTVLIAPGTYQLTRAVAIRGPLRDVTLRGATDLRDDVVLLGAGVNDTSVHYGVWVGGDVQRLTIANLTIRDVYYHPIILNAGPTAPRIYNVHLVNGGEQLLKTNPNPDNISGIDDGVIEHSVFEYSPTSKNWYANAIQVLGGKNWVIRNNLVRNIRAPLGEMAGPAVLAWFASGGTVVEGNTFVNCQREISFGLIDRTPNDHTGGIIRNNFIYRDASVLDGDVAIAVFDSAGTKVLHNTIVMLDAYPNAIEYRFAGATGVAIANNLVSKAITARQGAVADVTGNITLADPGVFVNTATGDLHLKSENGLVAGRCAASTDASLDWDGFPRALTGPVDCGADEFGNVPPAAPAHVRVLP